MNVPNYKKQTFWQGALLLTFAGLLTKILSAAYRVPYQNIAGDIGFYIYQQVYPFYGIAIALSLYGFPVVISKLISEVRENKNTNESVILIHSFILLFLFGLMIFLALFSFSSLIAIGMGDENLALPIKMVSFTFLLLPFISILRGYFQGHENMVPTAISQIAEQSIRVGSILLLAYLLVSRGYSYYEVGTGAIFGSVTGGFAALAVLLAFRKSYFASLARRKYLSPSLLKSVRTFPFRKLIISSLTICTTGLTLVLLQLVDSFTLYSFLIHSGQDSTIAKVEKGVFDRGQPLIQLGVVLATSLSLSLVPAISKAVLDQNYSAVIQKSSMALKISLVVGVGATFGLISIMKHTNVMLFTNMAGTNVLSILSISILFLSISLTAAAILQGLGSITSTAIFVLIGVLVKWILNGLLIPKYATFGAAVSSVIAICFIMVLTFTTLYRKLGNRSLLTKSFLLKTFIAGVGMSIVLKGYELVYFNFIPINDHRFISSVYTLSAVLIGSVAFILLVILLKLFEKDELIEGIIRKKRFSKQ
jgi:PST family polysaccharide transporter